MSDRPASGGWPTVAQTVSAELPVVPGYEVLAELGRGGMGVVYKAREASSSRFVALKLIRDVALASPAERARFRIETQAAARMRHPHIVEVLAIGEHEGRPYFAMELVEGGRLDKWIAGVPQPATHAASLVHKLALAVAHAHAQQVVHRDLKPANILMQNAVCGMQIDAYRAPAEKCPTGDHESAICNLNSAIPKISDFGLAKRLDTESTALTQDGAVLGTAGYMAPEQAAGRASEVGVTADVYALGAILYECLTGQPPFRAASWGELLELVLHDDPTPPTRRQPDVPGDLEAICLKCLEKDPARRYASAGELADELGRFLAGAPIVAVPLTALERLTRQLAREGYTIVAEIGRGPRSIVFHARHGPLTQDMAIKVFTPLSGTRESWEARARRYAEIRPALAHPQVVPVLRTGWCDQAPFLALEYAARGSLADRITGKPYALVEALRLVEQLAEIVSYLHRQGVVHANLKPRNVLFAAGGIPCLSDLRLTSGLYHTPMPSDDADPIVLGYLLPEVLRDASCEPRFHADVYGLGLILYELLTGRPPFAAPTAREMLEQVQSQEPTPATQLNAAIPPLLESVCMRCLAKNPWHRYMRVYDLAMIVGRLRKEIESPNRPERSVQRART